MLRIFLIIFSVLAEEDFELSPQSSGQKLTHKLFHSFDGENWEERGTIHLSIYGDKRRKPLISVKNVKFEKEKLKSRERYYIGVYSENDSGFLVQSSIPACFIFGSDLQDSISVLVDQETGKITAINYKSESRNCEKSTTALKLQTMAEVINTKEALKPYFALPKPEEMVEQQSFFRKYVSFM